MIIDAATQQHLELISSWKDSRKSGSLLAMLDLTETSMGGRMLKQWVLHPLLTVEDINQRLDAVEFLASHQSLRQQLRELLKKVYDLERISGKIALSSASAQDLIALKSSIAFIPRIRALLHQDRHRLAPTGTIGLIGSTGPIGLTMALALISPIGTTSATAAGGIPARGMR